jgi:hypothetical protein
MKNNFELQALIATFLLFFIGISIFFPMGAIEKLPFLFEIWHGPKTYNTMFCKDLLKD